MLTQSRLKVRNILLSAMTLLSIGASSLSHNAALADIPANTGLPPAPTTPGGTGTMMNPTPPQPQQPAPGSTSTPNPNPIMERYMFTYRPNSASPVVYIGTGYTYAYAHSVGQVIAVTGITGVVNATVTAVDDTVPYNAQLLNSPVSISTQYQTNSPQFIYGSGLQQRRRLFK